MEIRRSHQAKGTVRYFRAVLFIVLLLYKDAMLSFYTLAPVS